MTTNKIEFIRYRRICLYWSIEYHTTFLRGLLNRSFTTTIVLFLIFRFSESRCIRTEILVNNVQQTFVHAIFDTLQNDSLNSLYVKQIDNNIKEKWIKIKLPEGNSIRNKIKRAAKKLTGVRLSTFKGKSGKWKYAISVGKFWERANSSPWNYNQSPLNAKILAGE